MSRGHLWEDLEGEIADEFGALGVVDAGGLMDLGCTVSTALHRKHLRLEWYAEDKALPPDLLARLRARRYEVVVEHRREHATGMTSAEKGRALRARRALEGRCVECENKRAPGISRCDTHAKKLSDYNKTKRQEARGMKERLDEVRSGTTHHFNITTKCDLHDADDEARKKECERCGGSGTYEVKGYVIANTYPDGRLGEIFLNVGKTSSSEVWVDQWARAASFALQYGAPVNEFFSKFVATRFEPSGATNNKSIKRCTSILDYVSRWVLLKFGAKAEVTEVDTSKESHT